MTTKKKTKKVKQKLTLEQLASVIRYRFQDIADLGYGKVSIALAYNKEMDLIETEIVQLIKDNI